MSDHDRLVEFLHDTTRLDELLALPAYTLFEPVIRTRPERITIGEGSRIDSFVKLEGGTGLTIGRFVHVASFAHLNIGGGETILENYSAVASGGKIVSGGNRPGGLTMSACASADQQKILLLRTIIGRYACVLTNATVLAGVTLGEGAVLAAGGVATRDIPPWEIWAGVPARFHSKRVIDKR